MARKNADIVPKISEVRDCVKRRGWYKKMFRNLHYDYANTKDSTGQSHDT
jgi:hypothetical protein